ncbi:hypothetical protein NC796_00025 [Aliifodinibius sp. S!AR15-10]|uniref:hypothetical protein n=1 Tax=Aliifodinibius sp. S!AR15-10 TaxID=2950437 RepID=UPI00285C26EC|nr:hypothetical protein [Aliifodinibius sp. S!AR15-10]MDR8389499.1 hypothetical protein [Aliifodinibius sp. S!AR15-10]
MQENKKLYIEILASAYNTGGFLRRKLQGYVFEDYLELLGEKAAYIEELKEKYRGTTKKHLEKDIKVENMQIEYERKVSSLETILFDLDLKEFDELNLNKDRYKSVESVYKYYRYKSVESVYKYYRYKTGQKKDSPVKVFRLNKPVLYKIIDMIKRLGKDFLELKILREVENHLRLTTEYYPMEENVVKKTVDRAADACKEVYFSNTNISRDELIERVLNEYHIQNYDHLSPKKTEKRTKKAAKQWVRDRNSAKK